MPDLRRRSSPAPDPTAGLYPGVRDRTDDFGDLSYGALDDPSEVVLHQTGGSRQSTLNAYDSRIRNGEHVGAHYLVDTDGSTELTVPTDRQVGHTRGHNREAIGIENVGTPIQLDNSRPRNDRELQAFRDQVADQDLAPGFRDRLLGMDRSTVRDQIGDHDGVIYGDITGEQKRSTWLLANRLADDHDLDLKDDFASHEHLANKKPGEGENIEEFIDAMVDHPGNVAALEERLALLRAEGGDGVEQLAELVDLERRTLDALAVDGTQTEANQVDAEAILGEGGPATERETLRSGFYDDFWARQERIRGSLE